MPDPRNMPDDAARVDEAASLWLARRDRELTAVEQDEYLQWLRQDPRHGQAIARLGKAWNALELLASWRPEHSVTPNPDLLARPLRPRRNRWRFTVPVLAAAAALAVVFFANQPRERDTPAPRHGVRVIPPPENLVLTDGSVVQLNEDGEIEADFTPAERRVKLLQGEAHFTVAKNTAWPFVVHAGSVSVRAVGTAFEVRRASAAVEVLVTEGKVHIERPALTGMHPASAALVAGERASVDTTPRAAPPVIATASPAEIERTLAWQGVRLEFAGLPLGEVVAEFNLRNPARILVVEGDAATVRVGGTFRADNVEAFVRLLESSFGVTAVRRPDGTTVLRRVK
jgi:transmembrane sensor